MKREAAIEQIAHVVSSLSTQCCTGRISERDFELALRHALSAWYDEQVSEGQRLTEEWRALEAVFTQAKIISQADKQDEPDCTCALCAAVAAVERSRGKS